MTAEVSTGSTEPAVSGETAAEDAGDTAGAPGRTGTNDASETVKSTESTETGEVTGTTGTSEAAAADERGAEEGGRLGRYRAKAWTWAKPRLRVPGPHAIAVTLITLTFAALYATYSLVRHYHGETGLLDLGIYDQALRSYSHFQPPHAPIVAILGPDSLGKLQWSDHFTPILAVLAPLYWIHDSPSTLLVAQAFLFALGIPPLWVFTRRALGAVAAYFVVIAFGVSWTIQGALWFPFHEVAFAVPIMAWMLERFQAGRYRQAALISLLLLGVKEDLGLVVAVLGGYLIWRGCVRWGVGLLIGGPAATMFITKVIIPASGGSPNRDWSYYQFGKNPTELGKHLAAHPLASMQYMVTPEVKANTLLWLFAPMLFLALRSPLVLLTVPLLAERMLSSNGLYWNTGYHYNAFVVVPLFCAAVDGARRFQLPERVAERLPGRLAPWPGRLFGPAWAAVVAVIALVTLPTWPMWQEMTTRSWWHPYTPRVRQMQEALRHVPSGVWVDASNGPGIMLTDRDKVQLWSMPGDRSHYTAPWIFADVGQWTFPFQDLDQQKRRVEQLKQRGYKVVYDKNGWVVLHNPDGPQELA